MRAEEHDFAARGEFVDQTAQDEGGIDVESGERLVQQDEFRIVQTRGRQQDLLSHSFRIRRDRDIAIAVQPKQPQKTKRFVIHQPLRNPAQLAHQNKKHHTKQKQKKKQNNKNKTKPLLV